MSLLVAFILWRVSGVTGSCPVPFSFSRFFCQVLGSLLTWVGTEKTSCHPFSLFLRDPFRGYVQNLIFFFYKVGEKTQIKGIKLCEKCWKSKVLIHLGVLSKTQCLCALCKPCLTTWALDLEPQPRAPAQSPGPVPRSPPHCAEVAVFQAALLEPLCFYGRKSFLPDTLCHLNRETKWRVVKDWGGGALE